MVSVWYWAADMRQFGERAGKVTPRDPANATRCSARLVDGLTPVEFAARSYEDEPQTGLTYQ